MPNILFLFLTIIIILIIFYLNVKKKDTFITEITDIQEARKKLNFQYNLIGYQKGTPGYDGEKGKIGPTGPQSDIKIRGLTGLHGKDGLNYGSLLFKNTKSETISELTNTQTNKKNDLDIKVPNAEQGDPGVVGTIKFINHLGEEIGSYYPPIHTYARTLEPIIINVPKGRDGPKGEAGDSTSHPQGPRGIRGNRGEQGEQGPIGEPGIQGAKGPIGGADDVDGDFNSVKVNNKVCFKDNPSECMDIDILETLVNYEDYENIIRARRDRLKIQLCKLCYFNKYNLQKNPNYDELKVEYIRQLDEIDVYFGENLTSKQFEEIKDELPSPLCPAPTHPPPECACDGPDATHYIYENCRCEKLTTNCGVGSFISRYSSLNDKRQKVEDNKCAPCTFTRDHVDEASGELYVGCDGVYDGVVASCDTTEYIEVTGGSEGYKCTKCLPGDYINDSRTGKEECPEGHMCINGVKTACPANTYQSKRGQSQCTSCITSCNPGQYIITECGGAGNNSCAECDGKTTWCYNSNSVPCTICAELGQSTINECTKTSDTTCLSNEITVYQNSNYSGSSERWSRSWDGYGGGSDIGLDLMSWWNDRISGFKKTAGASVGIHQHRLYKGLCTDLTKYGGKIDFTRADLDRSNKSWDWGWWNDRISSISIPSKCEAGKGSDWVPNTY